MLTQRAKRRTAITIFGKTVKSPVFAGAGPATQTVENCLKILENGAGAVELSFIRGNSNIFDTNRRTDLYAVIPEKKDAYNGKFYGLISTGMHVEKDHPEEFINTTRENLRKVKSQSDGQSLIVANIGAVGYKGDGVYTWGQMAKMAQESGADAISLHLQTGNLMAGGIFSRDPLFLKRIVDEVRENSTLPIIAKLPIEGCEPSMLADNAYECGADAVASTGRFIGLVPDINTGECALGGHIGYGGSWALPNTCAWAARMYKDNPKRVLIPGGGVNSWEDIVKVIMCGGTLVQACTWPMVSGYGVIAAALDTINTWMKDKGYESLDDLRGTVAMSAVSSPELWARTPKRKQTPKYGISIDESKCVKCGRCLNNCYFDAITETAEAMRIDIDKCQGCGCCLGTCPFNAIR